MRGYFVVQAVAGKEGNVNRAVGDDGDGRRWCTPWSGDVYGFFCGIALKLGNTGTSNDGDMDLACVNSVVVMEAEMMMDSPAYFSGRADVAILPAQLIWLKICQ